jgi:hypothetical protein
MKKWRQVWSIQSLLKIGSLFRSKWFQLILKMKNGCIERMIPMVKVNQLIQPNMSLVVAP